MQKFPAHIVHYCIRLLTSDRTPGQNRSVSYLRMCIEAYVKDAARLIFSGEMGENNNDKKDPL